MIKSGSTPRLSAIGAKFQSVVRLKWFFGLAIALLFTVAATSPSDRQAPDAQYIHIMNIIDRADALRVAGQTDAAKAKYREAQVALMNFKASNPLFDPKTVAYRLKEVTERADTRPVIVEPVTPAANPKPKLEAESATSKSIVKLIDAGAEPRKVLRLHVKAGDKQAVTMTIKMTMEMPMPGAPAKPLAIPAVRIPMDVTIKNVAANGDISYEVIVGEAGVVEESGASPEMMQILKGVMGSFKGITAEGIRSNRGISKKVDVKAPAGASPAAAQAVDQMKDMLKNIGLPLPEDAVGLGAKWEAKMPVNSDGVALVQTEDYQLDAVDGDRLTTSLTFTQTATNQTIHDPAMGPGPIHLIQMNGNGKGTGTDDLSKLISLQGSVDIHSEMNLETTANGKQPITKKTDVNVVIESK